MLLVPIDADCRSPTALTGSRHLPLDSTSPAHASCWSSSGLFLPLFFLAPRYDPRCSKWRSSSMVLRINQQP